MVEPPQRPSAGAMGHHPRCFARNISSLKGAVKKQKKLEIYTKNGGTVWHFLAFVFVYVFAHFFAPCNFSLRFAAVYINGNILKIVIGE